MEEGEQLTETPAIVEAAVTVTVAEPDFVGSCVDVAVRVAVPGAEGVKTPAALKLPMFDGLTDHVTLVLLVPVTALVQVDV